MKFFNFCLRFSVGLSALSVIPICAESTAVINFRGKTVTLYEKTEDIPEKECQNTHVLELDLAGIYCVDQQINQEDLDDIKKEIVRYYQRHNRPLVKVYIPEQDVTDGCIKFVVIESKVGNICATGARWFDNELLVKYIRLNPGDTVDEKKLVQDLTWMNRNPFRRTDVIYSPGKEPNTTDIELVTTDRFPLRVYATADNTGLKTTGPGRVMAGFNWGNAFDLDQRLSYQYTTSSDNPKEFQAHTAQYTVPLPWRHIFMVYGGYSEVDAHLPFSHFRSHGTSVQGSGRYIIPLPPANKVLEEFTFGFDYKRTNNTIEFSEVPVFGKTVNLAQFMVEYSLGYEVPWTKISFFTDVFGSPGGMMPDQTKADYNSLRKGASPRYLYGRLAFIEIFYLPKKFSIMTTLKGQLATNALLPSEQYGIGGFDTVRGYEERILNGDDALQANVEFRSPALRAFDRKCSRDALQFLVFGDYGFVHNYQPTSGEPGHAFIASAGPGLRYNMDPYINIRLDWGIKLHKIQNDPSFSRLHFSVTMGY